MKIFNFFLISFLSIFNVNAIEFQKSNELFSTGLKYFNEDQYATSINFFEKYLQVCDSDALNKVEAEYHIAFCSIVLDFPNSDKIFKNFIKKYQKHSRVSNAYYQLGNINFSEDEYASSIEYYNKVDENVLDDMTKYEMYYRLGYSYLNVKNFEKALNYFNKIKEKKHPYSHLANYYTGFIYIRKNKFDLAEKDLLKAMEVENFKTTIPYLLAKIYFKKKEYKKVIEFLNKALKSNIVLKNHDEIELLLAESYRLLGDYATACKHYDNFALYRNNKLERDVIFNNAYCLLMINDTNKAIKKFQFLTIKDDLISQKACYYLGKIYLMKKQKEDSLLAFEKSHDIKIHSPFQEESLFLYSKLNYELGNPLISIETIKTLKQDYPNSKFKDEIESLLADLYLSTDNYELAIKQVEQNQNKSPKMLKVYQKGTFYKASEYFNNGEYEKAINFFEKSLQNPIDSNLKNISQVWLGDSFFALNKYDQAMNNYSKAIKNKNLNKEALSQALYGFAYCKFYLGKYSESINLYTQIIKTKEINKEPLILDVELRLADCYYFLNDYSSALTYYDRTLKKSPRNLYAYLQKGIIYSLLNKNDLAEKNLKEVIKNGKHDELYFYDYAKYQLAELAFKKGDYELAIKRFSSFILERYHSKFVPSSMLKQIISHINLGQKDKAIKLCATLIHDYPKTDEAYHALLELQKIADPNIFNTYIINYKNSNPDKKSLESLEFETAKNYFYDQKYSKAIKAFESYLNIYPKSSNDNEVYYMLAQSYNRSNMIEKAIDTYKKVLEDENLSFYNKALLQIARLEYDTNKIRKALKHFETLEKFANNNKEMLMSYLGIMKSAYQLKDYEKCTNYSVRIIKNNVSLNYFYEAKLYYAKCQLQKGETKTAIEELQYIVKESTGIHSAEANYLIAEELYKEKKYKESLEELFSLTKKFNGYTFWIDQAFLLIAENYIEMNMIFQAKVTLKSIIEKSDNKEIINKANEKLELVNKKLDDKLDLVETDQLQSTDNKDFKIID